MKNIKDQLKDKIKIVLKTRIEEVIEEIREEYGDDDNEQSIAMLIGEIDGLNFSLKQILEIIEEELDPEMVQYKK